MAETYLVAIDLGKRHFQVCATDASGKALFNRAFSRQMLQEFLDKLPAYTLPWKPVRPATMGVVPPFRLVMRFGLFRRSM